MPQLTIDQIQSNKKTENLGLNQNFVKKILTKYQTSEQMESIEAGFVNYFLYKNNLTVGKNLFLKEIINNDTQETFTSLLKKENFDIDIFDLVRIFELLIPSDDRRINGAVYTPPFIVNYIVENTLDKKGTVADCSCGSGIFLLSALKRLHAITKLDVLSIIEKFLFGADILDYSIRRTKIILTLYAIQNGVDQESINFNLKIADSLEKKWEDLFPDLLRNEKGFDFIIGNPPYVRIQDLDVDLREKLSKKWTTISDGNFNLYFAFIELGMNILKKSGKLGYITPNNYFTSLAAFQLRTYLHNHKKISRIINFNHLKIFENAQTYTSILLMRKDNVADYFEYCYIEQKNLSERILHNLQFSKYYFKWLDDEKWRLMTEDDYQNIKKCETIGIPLGKLCKIRVGFATLKDTIFFTTEKNSDFSSAFLNNQEILIEKAITRKAIKIPEMKNEEDITNNKRRIIFPYIKKSNKYEIMTEEYIKEKFPYCYQYLSSVKTELSKRDKGKKSYPDWFAWGRSQGMDYKGPRLYTKTFSKKPNFLLDYDDNLFCNGYGVFPTEHIRAIQKILNSIIMEYYAKKTSYEIEGDYQCYQKNFIEKFNIPVFTEEDWLFLEEERDKKKIDTWLIKKYGLKNIVI